MDFYCARCYFITSSRYNDIKSKIILFSSHCREEAVVDLILDIVSTHLGKCLGEADNISIDLANKHESGLVLLRILVPAFLHLLVIGHVVHGLLHTLGHLVLIQQNSRNLTRERGDVSYSCDIVKVVRVVQPSQLLEHTHLISQAFLDLLNNIINRWTLLFSLSTSLSLSASHNFLSSTCGKSSTQLVTKRCSQGTKVGNFRGIHAQARTLL